MRRFSISEWGFGFWENDKFHIYMILRKKLFESYKIKKSSLSLFYWIIKESMEEETMKDISAEEI